MQHYCFVRGAAEVRQVWGQLFGGRFEDRRFAGEGVLFFLFHTELPLVVIRPRPGPPTYDLDLPAADRRAAAEARRVDFV